MSTRSQSPTLVSLQEDKQENSDIWTPYVSKGDDYDKDLFEKWKDGVDVFLLFTGLHSAVLSAFLIASWGTVQPDTASATVDALAALSQQLVLLSAGQPIHVTMAYQKEEFVPPWNALAVNGLWFTSLFISLMAVILAMLIKEWINSYSDHKPVDALERTMQRQFRFESLNTWMVPSIVSGLPIAIHIAVFLFFVGLVLFAWPVSPMLSVLMLILLMIGFVVYIALAVAPLVYPTCPYKSPAYRLFRLAGRAALLFLRWISERKVSAARDDDPRRTEEARQAVRVETTKEASEDLEQCLIKTDGMLLQAQALKWLLESPDTSAQEAALRLLWFWRVPPHCWERIPEAYRCRSIAKLDQGIHESIPHMLGVRVPGDLGLSVRDQGFLLTDVCLLVFVVPPKDTEKVGLTDSTSQPRDRLEQHQMTVLGWLNHEFWRFSQTQGRNVLVRITHWAGTCKSGPPLEDVVSLILTCFKSRPGYLCPLSGAEGVNVFVQCINYLLRQNTGVPLRRDDIVYHTDVGTRYIDRLEFHDAKRLLEHIRGERWSLENLSAAITVVCTWLTCDGGIGDGRTQAESLYEDWWRVFTPDGIDYLLNEASKCLTHTQSLGLRMMFEACLAKMLQFNDPEPEHIRVCRYYLEKIPEGAVSLFGRFWSSLEDKRGYMSPLQRSSPIISASNISRPPPPPNNEAEPHAAPFSSDLGGGSNMNPGRSEGSGREDMMSIQRHEPYEEGARSDEPSEETDDGESPG